MISEKLINELREEFSRKMNLKRESYLNENFLYSYSNKSIESSMNKSADEIDMKKEKNSSRGSIIEKGWVNVEVDAPL